VRRGQDLASWFKERRVSEEKKKKEKSKLQIKRQLKSNCSNAKRGGSEKKGKLHVLQ